MDDWQLLQTYTRDRSEAAFKALVERYAGLVHSSALRQLRDAELAADVAQAVFILLARKGGSLRRGTVLSGWLFQTTRFVAARAMRSEQRRQRREQEAFDMQQLTLGEEAWRQMAPVIDEALSQLPGIDRDAILLRYLEGRSVREVGASLGISEEAAKKRVARAMERLRETLGRTGAILGTATIATALASHAVAAPPSALLACLPANALAATKASGMAATLVKEVLAAWRWAKLKWIAGIGLSGALLLILMFATVPRDGESGGNNFGQPPLVTTSLAAVPVDPAQAASSRRNNPNLKHLTLRVVDADFGVGITNARVFLSIWRNSDIENHWALTTDGAGVCDVPYEPDAERIDVGVLQDGWVARYATWSKKGLIGIPSEYVLRLARVTNSIGGIVRDPQGRPAADVQIWFEGHESGDSAHRERPQERFGFIWPVPVTRTDQHGKWSVAFISPAHRGFHLEARHSDFADTTMVSSSPQTGLDRPESEDLKRLWAGQLLTTVNTAFTIAGLVVDERNRPIAGASVHQSDERKHTETDSSGHFRVSKLKEGLWSFTVTAEGFAPVRTNVSIGTAMPPLVVTLKTGAVLRVRVIDEDGLEVPDAEVGMEQWGANRHDFSWRERTDHNGRIEWRSAPPEVELELFARGAGLCYTRDVRVEANGEEHTITVQHVLDVYGRVTDAVAGWAVSDFKATPGYGAHDRFHDSELRWYGGSTVRGTNGMFQLSFDEKVFPWRLRITAEGYEDWISEPLTNRRQAVLDIAMKRFQPGEAVRGAVLLPDGTPAANAQVALLTFDHNVTLRNQFFEGNPRWLTKTDQRGEFTFPVNRLAHSVAAVSIAGYAHLRVREPQQPVTLRLEPWGRVEGSVDDGAAAHGVVTIELYDPTADNYQGRVRLLGSYSVQPDPNRRFNFEHVPSGEFCVFVNSMNNIPFHHQTPITVRPGETTKVEIREQPGTRVTGRFVPPPGMALDWRKDLILSHLNADLPPTSNYISSAPADERRQRELEFWTSPAGREQINTPRVYSALVRDDGTFLSLEKLPPGKYCFSTIFKNHSARHELVIGEEQPDELQLGEIPLQPAYRSGK